MSRGKNSNGAERIDLLQGTLDMLILRTLVPGPAHGHTIAHVIERNSDEVLQVEHGSLYPALHRLVRKGYLSARDGTSENNRKARFYSLTEKGRRQLDAHRSRWARLSRAIAGVMNPAPEGE